MVCLYAGVLLLNRLPLDFVPKLFALFTGVIISVGCAYHMMGILRWMTMYGIQGLSFSFAGAAGWISVCVSKKGSGLLLFGKRQRRMN
jgi:hypothetical protein